VRQEHPTAAAPAKEATGDEKLDDAMIVVTALFLVAVVDVRAALVRVTPFPEKMGEQQVTPAAAAKHATRDEKPDDATIVVAACFLVVVIDLRAALVRLTPFPEKMGEQQLTAAAAAKHAAGDEKPDDATIVVAARFLVVVIDLRAALVRLTPFPEKMGEQQVTAAAAAKHAARDEKLDDATIVVAARFLVVVIDLRAALVRVSP
jgi:hypothetical protein